MAVYVDALMTCVVSKQWRWPKACHMFVDVGDLKELHDFAASIGLKREWFQSSPGRLPHYDLNESRRKKALKAGALELTREGTVTILRRWKTYKPKKVYIYPDCGGETDGSTAHHIPGAHGETCYSVIDKRGGWRQLGDYTG